MAMSNETKIRKAVFHNRFRGRKRSCRKELDLFYLNEVCANSLAE